MDKGMRRQDTSASEILEADRTLIERIAVLPEEMPDLVKVYFFRTVARKNILSARGYARVER